MKRIVIASACLSGVLGSAWMLATAGEAAKDAAATGGSEVTFPFDNCPTCKDTIDVSGYPDAQKKNYEIFSQKCSKCHTLARPINDPSLATPKDWTAYVAKMAGKKRSGLNGDDNKEIREKITDFLIYDSSVRKKDILEKRLKAEKDADSGADKKDSAKQEDKPSKDAK